MSKKEEKVAAEEDRLEAARAKESVRVCNAAKAAGAQQVIDLFGNHPATQTAREFVISLGGVQPDYVNDDPVSEMQGVDEVLKYTREHTGMFLGNAPSIRTAIQERIDVAGRQNQPKAVKEIDKGRRRTSDYDG